MYVCMYVCMCVCICMYVYVCTYVCDVYVLIRIYNYLNHVFLPVGAAHTVLVPYWSRQLRKKIMNAYQCSPRGGDLTVTMVEEGEGHKGKGGVVLKGKAFILVHGKIMI